MTFLNENDPSQLSSAVSSGATAEPDETLLYSEQVSLLYSQSIFGFVAALAGSVVLTVVLSGSVENAPLAIWQTSILLITLLRYALTRKYRQKKPPPAEAGKWSSFFLIGSAASGIVWGAAGIFLFADQSVIHQVFLIFMLGGMCSGAVAAYSYHMPVFAAFAIPAITPITIRLFMMGDETYLAMGLMTALFLILMLGVARRFNSVAMESLKLGFAKKSLATHLASGIAEHKKTEETLRKLNNAIEHAAEMVVITNSEGIIEYVNPAFESITEYTKKEAVGTNPRVLNSGKHNKAFFKDMWNTIKSGSVWHGELINKKKSGELYNEEMTISPVLDNTGKVSHFVAIKHDITKRKEAEEALRQSEQRLSLHVDQTPLGVIEWDTDFKVTKWNPAAERIFGYSMDEAIGRHPTEIILPENVREHVDDLWKALLQRKGGERSANDNITKDGKVITCDWYNTPLVDDKGNVVGAASLVQDVTEQKKAEENLQKTKEFLDKTFASLDEAVLVVNLPSRKIISCNRALEDIFGYSKEELIGKSTEFLHISPEMFVRFGTEMRSALDEKGVYKTEFQLKRKNGDVFWSEHTVTTVKDNLNQQVDVVSVFHDITERKQAEEELAERMRHAEFRAEIGLALTESGSLRGILQRCCTSMVENLDAAFARVWIFNDKDNMLELEASAGMYTHIDGGHSRIPLGKFKIGAIAKERKPHLTNSIIGDPRVSDQEWAKREGMVAFAGHPLVMDDKLVGVMALFARTPISKTTVQLLESVAHEIALGIERKKAEEALKENDKLLTSFFNGTLDVMALLDNTGKTLAVNKNCAKSLDHKVDDLIGRNIFDFMPSEVAKLRLAKLQEVVRTGQPVHFDDNRRDIFFENHFYPITDDSGKVGKCAIVARDITERKKAKEALHNISIGVLSVTGEAFLDKMTLYLRETLDVEYVFIGEIDKNDPMQVNVIAVHAKGKQVEPFTYSLEDTPCEEVAKSGTCCYPSGVVGQFPKDVMLADMGIESYVGAPIRNEAGKTTGLLVLLDTKPLANEEIAKSTLAVSADRVSAELARKQAEEKIKNRTVELEKANMELEEFNYIATHDLMEPLRTLSNYTEILRRNAGKNLNKRALLSVKHISEATKRMRLLVNELLQLSSVGKAEMKMENVDLNDCMSKVASGLEAFINEADGKLEWEKLPTITGDKTMLGMAFQNLVHNALKFRSEKSAEVTVSSRSFDDMWEITIADNGIGIDPVYFDKVFEPFKRLHNRRDYEGTGIGLSICRKVIDFHGGDIKIESSKGTGSKFKLFFKKNME